MNPDDIYENIDKSYNMANSILFMFKNENLGPILMTLAGVLVKVFLQSNQSKNKQLELFEKFTNDIKDLIRISEIDNSSN